MPAAAGPQAGWAADFQRLHISQTPSPGPGPAMGVAPIPVQRFRAEAPLVRNAGVAMGGGWGAEFMRAQQQQQQGPQMGLGKGKEVESGLQEQQPGYGLMSGAGGMGLGMNMGTGYGMQQPQMGGMEMAQPQHQQAQQQDAQVSQADFDAAFEEAMLEVEREQQAQEQERLQNEILEHHDNQSITINEETELPQTTLEKSDIRIGSDTIDYTEQEDRANRTPDQEQRDADELARTAGQLLTLVQHDTSAKFQNSQFLDLMRRIRDREVEVLDNDLQATAPESQMRAEPPAAAAASYVQHRQGNNAEAADMRPHDPNQFSFPDLNGVYAPTAADLNSQGADTFDPASLQQRQQQVPAGSWQPNAWPMQAVPAGSASDADAMYTSAADEYPQSELHPGGRYYPEMSPRMSGARMSGVEEGERTA